MTGAGKFARVLRLFFLMTLFSAVSCFAAGGAESDRVRILDFANGSASGLLFMELDKGIESQFKIKPAWHSRNRASADDITPLAIEAASGAFDAVVTGDEPFAEDLAERGALQSRTPLFYSELILLGPHADEKKFSGRGAAEIMKALFASEKLFFTPMEDAWISAQEAILWKKSGVSDPSENFHYVESGRTGVSLLLQVEEEGGYTLATADAFAQYMTSTREPEPLVKLTDTGLRRTHYLCLIDHRGFRQGRVKNAQTLAAWLSGDAAAKTIDNFTLAGIRPFRTK